VVLTGLSPVGKRREKSRLVTGKGWFGFTPPGSTRPRSAGARAARTRLTARSKGAPASAEQPAEPGFAV